MAVGVMVGYTKKQKEYVKYVHSDHGVDYLRGELVKIMFPSRGELVKKLERLSKRLKKET